jgi:hypothetical membrane protein
MTVWLKPNRAGSPKQQGVRPIDANGLPVRRLCKNDQNLATENDATSCSHMKRDNRLLFAPLGAVILSGAILALPSLVPGYNSIHQTVSEIGEVGSPARLPFTVMLCLVAACLLVFATAVHERSRIAGCAPWPAYLIACMAISAAGVGIFAFPHPLHNVFGLSELIGYQAPLAFALAWRRHPASKALVDFSWVMFILVWLAIALNMSSLVRQGAVWEFLKPGYGLVQRALFAVWFAWAATVGVMLWRWDPHSRNAAPRR